VGVVRPEVRRPVHHASRPISTALLRRIVQLPLLWKLILIDASISLLTFTLARGAAASQKDEIIGVAFVMMLAVNAALVYWALLPLRRLEDVAARVARGAFDARVPESGMTDIDIARIGRSFNQLLDTVLADRARARTLAGQVIRAGDQERARIARELHDSTAQSLGALDLMLTAAIRDPGRAATMQSLEVMQAIVDETWRDVRTLSHTIHPRVLDDLGLAAALELLGRRTHEQAGIRTTVRAAGGATVPVVPASVLYRVAQESVRNAVRHAGATHIAIDLEADERTARLTVSDDGCGFDAPAAEAHRPGMGLFIMRERVDLVRGQLEIVSETARGTQIRATVPLTPPAAS
jgi:signal transduction histidine kinase